MQHFPGIFTITEVSLAIGLSKTTVKAKMRTGELAYSLTNEGRRVIFNRQHLDQWFRQTYGKNAPLPNWEERYNNNLKIKNDGKRNKDRLLDAEQRMGDEREGNATAVEQTTE